jgi:hypothetical protein
MPCSAMAQTAPDTTPPAITITSPVEGTNYTVGQAVPASYDCTDAESQVSSCAGNVASGVNIDTAAAGPHTFTVNTSNAAGLTASKSVGYNVVVADDGGVGGQTPATLTLNLGTPGVFAPFVPGVGQNYTTTVVATIISSAGNATLSAADPSAVQTSHLVNGAFFLSQPLEIGASKGGAQGQPSTTPIGGNSNPTTLLTYGGPVNDSPTVLFKQPILASEALRTGAYAKTLTFTLSTTEP